MWWGGCDGCCLVCSGFCLQEPTAGGCCIPVEDAVAWVIPRVCMCARWSWSTPGDRCRGPAVMFPGTPVGVSFLEAVGGSSMSLRCSQCLMACRGRCRFPDGVCPWTCLKHRTCLMSNGNEGRRQSGPGVQYIILGWCLQGLKVCMSSMW